MKAFAYERASDAAAAEVGGAAGCGTNLVDTRKVGWNGLLGFGAMRKTMVLPGKTDTGSN